MYKPRLSWRCPQVFVALATISGWAPQAYSECPTTSGLPAVFAYGTVAVSNALPVGEIIPGTVRSFNLIGKCASSSLYNKPIVTCPASGTEVAGMTGVYPTSLGGIGMRVRDAQGKPMVGTGTCSTDSSLGNSGSDGAFNVSGTFELVKTGPVSPGSVSGTYRSGVLNTGYVLNNGADSLTIASGTAIRSVSCSINPATANQTVFLATVSPTMFGSAGSVAARTPFALALNCQSGVKVSVTFSSASGKASIPSVLASIGTATGIGVQLLDATQTPITLDSSFILTSSSTGNMSFDFYAQYYRLGVAPISPGTVKAMAIFTMSYQ